MSTKDENSNVETQNQNNKVKDTKLISPHGKNNNAKAAENRQQVAYAEFVSRNKNKRVNKKKKNKTKNGTPPVNANGMHFKQSWFISVNLCVRLRLF